MSECKNELTMDEKELDILRRAVDIAQKKSGKKITNSPQVQRMISIVEQFLVVKKRICYGGTAINNLLPVEEQFYDRDIEIPDYDFFSDSALEDAKELADIYYKEGYKEVEAKAGQHFGTYKVFVDFIPVADITHLDKNLYKIVHSESIKSNGIFYAPPNYLRMSMYLELSRPAGDISRWEKVLKRLILLNKHYPLKGEKCDNVEFVRAFEGTREEEADIYGIVREALVSHGAVFFGGYACALYSRYMNKKDKKKFNVPDFDVLSEEADRTANSVKERLNAEGYKNVKVKMHEGIGEIISTHYEITVGKDTVAFIYEPLACHSYNTINIKGSNVKVATIDTMLSFYLAFLFAQKPYYDVDKILCMAEYLFKVQSKNRLSQKGLLRRFSINCYGKQHTKEDILGEKAKKFEELKDKKDSREYLEWFFKYLPSEHQNEKNSKRVKTRSVAKQSGERKTRKYKKARKLKRNKSLNDLKKIFL